MDSVSVSKGVFSYKGKYKIGHKKKRAAPREHFDEPWYYVYKETWASVENAAKAIRSNMFQQILKDVKGFVSKARGKLLDSFNNEILTAILLTGVNVPDHEVLFQAILEEIRSVTAHIAVIWSKDSSNVKNLVEESVHQFMHNIEADEAEKELRKRQCTMRALVQWHRRHLDAGEPLVIVITDFESASPTALRDFILILSSYSSTMKFVLIFGVATTLHAIHRSLSYDVTSKLLVEVFHMQTQMMILSDVVERTVFSSDIPFKLIGKAFQFLTDIFLFYDFSVESFLAGYKICMIQHFYGNNVSSLCCQPADIKARIGDMADDDIAEIKKLPSIKKHLQSTLKDDGKIAGLDDEKFKKILEGALNGFHRYMNQFLTVLKCLHCLTSSLPNSPMGKQLREVYTKAVYLDDLMESQEYKESLQLLVFLSKEELLGKLNEVLKIVETSEDAAMKRLESELAARLAAIRDASLEIEAAPAEIVTADKKLSRAQLKEKLLKMSQRQSRSPYKEAQVDLINYLDREVFAVHLANPRRMPANEIFCFADGNLAKQHIRGSLRAAIHTGLCDPRMYLNCKCCKLENEDAIPSTLPDLSIIYKLHLESRKLINMYDWLQAFLIIVDPENANSEQQDVDPHLQARFTRAVAELQFLGFIKTSRKKTDHVKRLT
ncbi:hypothetical protein KM043_010600 [Ampulex compressa]|nr:hypothetical protein KM043_010600 [Ampulex compressa]